MLQSIFSVFADNQLTGTLAFALLCLTCVLCYLNLTAQATKAFVVFPVAGKLTERKAIACAKAFSARKNSLPYVAVRHIANGVCRYGVIRESDFTLKRNALCIDASDVYEKIS